ncbi:MAG: (Fe-S)-binding protein, partial [Desulfosarcinaceae bacterium]
MPTQTKAGTSRFSLQQCLQISACTNCRSCADVCPAVKAANDGALSALVRLENLQRMLKGRNRGRLASLLGPKPISEEQWRAFSKTVFSCTLCGSCQQVCPVGIGLKDLWLSLRQDLVDTGHF